MAVSAADGDEGRKGRGLRHEVLVAWVSGRFFGSFGASALMRVILELLLLVVTPYIDLHCYAQRPQPRWLVDS